MKSSGDSRHTPLAIVGMACRLPDADDLDQYWQMLIEGRCAIADLPPDRFDSELYYDPNRDVRNKSYTRRGAVPKSRNFDPERCPISPQLARNADPTHLVMCQVAAEALRHAGMNPLNLPLRNTGVYVGHTIGSGLDADEACVAGIEDVASCLRQVDCFRQLPPDQQEAIVDDLICRVSRQFSPADARQPDLASHMSAGIISKGFGLNGPFAAVNAACASSLYALLLGARALQRGKIDMAIIGGASVCSAEWLVLFSAAQSLSPSQSRPFDHDADGLVVAEGYVAVVLKTLQRALADGDPIQAVIRGVGVSSDGKGRSLWAPRREGQVEAIRRAYATELDMADVQYIEAHSTATQLGDATEIASLTEVFGSVLPKGKKIPITSVKANIGHALEAAGLASLIKVVLSMQKGLIPPAINIEKLNTNVDWDGAPVCVPLKAAPWPAPAAGKPRRAGVNAFGIGGLNLHVVLDSYSNAAPKIAAARPVAGDPDDEAVAVIGRGCMFPEAHDVRAFWELLSSGRDPRQEPPADRSGAEPAHRGGLRRQSLLGGYVRDFRYDWHRHKIPPKQIEFADPLQFMVLEAADQAFHDAGCDRVPFDRKRTGVIVGTEFAGDFTFQLKLVLRMPSIAKTLRDLLASKGLSPKRIGEIAHALDEAVHARWPVLSDSSGSFSASCSAVRIAKTWNLMGGAAAIDSGAASGMSALSAAVDLLLSGDCNLVVCAAAQRNMNVGTYQRLAKAGILSEDPTRGPFDRGGSGYVPGEGAGAVLLKRLRDARRDGDKIHAVLRGVGIAHDDPAQALSLAMSRSLERAGLQPGDLAIAMTDASGTVRSDEQLVQALLVSQAQANRAAPLRIGSVVGQIGHTGGASAAASLLAAILAVQEGTMPGVFGLQAPLAAILRNTTVVRCGGADRATAVLCNSPGGRLAGAVLSQDKGLASSAILERATPINTVELSDDASRDLKSASTAVSIARRSILHAVEAPLPAGLAAEFTPNGAVAILGDNLAADALQQRLEAQQATVYRLLPSRGADALIAEIETLPLEPPIRAFFVMTGMDRGADRICDSASWQARRRLGVELPYLVLQKWGQLLQRHQVAGPFTLAAGTLLGGDLGVVEPVVAAEGGWIAGLLKAIGMEWNRYERPTRVKVCDFGPSDRAQSVADVMLRELAAGLPEVEVGCGGGRRRVLRATTEPVENLPRSELPRGSTWVVTGGARGITAEVALGLGRDYDLDLHLIGRTASPRDDAPWRRGSEDELKQIKRSIVRQAISEGKSPEKQWDRVKHDIEIYNNLQRMRRLGVRVTYHACDVGDWSALGQVLDEIRRTSGRIEGIIHGAGYARTGRLETQRRDELTSSIGAKVDGALGLMLLTRNDPLRYFVGFGSISGRYGGNGLSDYAAGNDMLAKLCTWFRTVRPDCAATCIQWQSWDAVGMAMLPDSSVGARDVLKMKFMPPDEGVEHLKQELRAGLPQSEVIIDDGQFEQLLRRASRPGE